MQNESPDRSFERRRFRARLSCAVYLALSLILVIVFLKLLSHQSAEPWILGRYSLPYFIFMIAAGVVPAYVAYLTYRFHSKTIFLLVGSALLGLTALVGIEIGGQIYAFFNPSFKILSFEPDRIVGWKMVPNFEATWAGHYWYAREFSVTIKTNAHGFRDHERTLAKPAGVTRVALLGDSMVEALQVSMEQTAGQLLEKKLNAESLSASRHRGRYEVLNFGVSNFSLGQNLLAWEQYASKFSPDYVFVFVAEIQMDRTVYAYDPNALSSSSKRLRIRPTFGVHEDNLTREPAADIDQFAKEQQRLIDSELSGKRVIKRSHGLFVTSLSAVSIWNRLMQWQRQFTAPRLESKNSRVVFKQVNQEIIDVNFKIIEELGRQIIQSGGKLIVVDAANMFPYLKWQGLSAKLQSFCAERGFGWIPLGKEILQAEENNTVVRWPHDHHLNVAGNEMFADSMYRWFLSHRFGERPAGSPSHP